MATGIDPNDPTPGRIREYKLGQGVAGTGASARNYCIIGNKTSAGSMTANALDTVPLEGEDDVIARCGIGSELFWLWKSIRAIDPGGAIYAACATESGGTAAACTFTISGTSDAISSVVFKWGGYKKEVVLDDAATPLESATKIKAEFDAWEGGAMPFTAATPTLSGSDYLMVVTARHKGPRSTDIINGGSATLGLRVEAKGVANSQTVTKTTGSAVAGATEDDHTTVLAAVDVGARQGLFYYIVTPKSDASPTTTDNGLGETSAKVKELRLPINGVDVQLVAASRLSSANAVSQSTASAMNNPWCTLAWAENNDRTCGMIAAEVAAIIRTRQLNHPGANLIGVGTTLPDPPTTGDSPTATEIRTALDRGLTPIVPENGQMRIKRQVTNQSKNGSGVYDYRVREGHINSVVDFSWAALSAAFEAQAQEFADDDPPENQPPPPRTTTPSSLKSILDRTIDQLAASKPFGTYNGPILKQSAVDEMKATSSVTKSGYGAFDIVWNIKAVEHMVKSETDVVESSAAQ